jgi:hypothetical protein
MSLLTAQDRYRLRELRRSVEAVGPLSPATLERQRKGDALPVGLDQRHKVRLPMLTVVFSLMELAPGKITKHFSISLTSEQRATEPLLLEVADELGFDQRQHMTIAPSQFGDWLVTHAFEGHMP